MTASIDSYVDHLQSLLLLSTADDATSPAIIASVESHLEHQRPLLLHPIDDDNTVTDTSFTRSTPSPSLHLSKAALESIDQQHRGSNHSPESSMPSREDMAASTLSTSSANSDHTEPDCEFHNDDSWLSAIEIISQRPLDTEFHNDNSTPMELIARVIEIMEHAAMSADVTPHDGYECLQDSGAQRLMLHPRYFLTEIEGYATCRVLLADDTHETRKLAYGPASIPTVGPITCATGLHCPGWKRTLILRVHFMNLGLRVDTTITAVSVRTGHFRDPGDSCWPLCPHSTSNDLEEIAVHLPPGSACGIATATTAHACATTFRDCQAFLQMSNAPVAADHTRDIVDDIRRIM